MVGRGEVLERMTTVEGPAGDLEALWQGGGIGVVHQLPVLLCPPHPRLGGSMDSSILAEIVWHLARRRHPTLRFNYAGVSASTGEIALPPLPDRALSTSEAVDEAVAPLVRDAEAALQQLLASTGARDVAVVGVSVGAFVAARLLAHNDHVVRGALVAPPVVTLPGLSSSLAQQLAHSGAVITVVVGSRDRHAPPELVEAACRAFAVPKTIDADHGFVSGLTACARLCADACGAADDDD